MLETYDNAIIARFDAETDPVKALSGDGKPCAAFLPGNFVRLNQ
ncbi:MAG: hypothetical protein R2861_05950 [Desulfobacterales bacterium]